MNRSRNNDRTTIIHWCSPLLYEKRLYIYLHVNPIQKYNHCSLYVLEIWNKLYRNTSGRNETEGPFRGNVPFLHSLFVFLSLLSSFLLSSLSLSPPPRCLFKDPYPCSLPSSPLFTAYLIIFFRNRTTVQVLVMNVRFAVVALCLLLGAVAVFSAPDGRFFFFISS